MTLVRDMLMKDYMKVVWKHIQPRIKQSFPWKTGLYFFKTLGYILLCLFQIIYGKILVWTSSLYCPKLIGILILC